MASVRSAGDANCSLATGQNRTGARRAPYFAPFSASGATEPTRFRYTPASDSLEVGTPEDIRLDWVHRRPIGLVTVSETYFSAANLLEFFLTVPCARFVLRQMPAATRPGQSITHSRRGRHGFGGPPAPSMKFANAPLYRRLAVLLLACATALGSVARAQDSATPFKPEEIEALVAPIALYPDDLLSQVLMASTYPLEVVQAARWVKANPNVKGEAAVKAVENQSWDVSVKSLVAFPQVLEPMNEKLDWTQKLGDAFLADQKSVLDAVQRLRKRAEDAGNLTSNEQQKVVVEQEAQQTIIKVVPADPQVIYVPAYNPTVVYGVWGYPAYPPYYWAPPPYYYPGGAFVRGFAWGAGVAASWAIFGGCNWGRGDVNVNVNRAVNIDRNYNRTNITTGGRWQHDASHRKGVAYRDTASREKYGNRVPGAEGRRDYRGREGRVGAGQRTGGDRVGAGQQRPAASDRMAAGNRQRTGASDRMASANRGGGRDNAFSGVGGGGAAQRDFERGRASNQSMERQRGSFQGGSRPSGMSRPSGGGFHGGGGRRR
jgi:hypothetical protein